MIGDDRIASIAGADYPYEADCKVTLGDGLENAWLTLKPYPEGIDVADPGSLQKVITTANDVGTGQITDDGSSDGTAVMRFDLTAADTTALGARDFAFDVKVRAVSGAEFYAARGLWSNSGAYTLSS